MNLIDEIKRLDNISINTEFIKQVEEAYSCELPDEVKKIISVSDDYCSYDDSIIRMDNGIILDPEEDLFFDFKSQNLIPVFDCYDNDYICYDYVNKIWCKFNSIVECSFDSNADFIKLISEE